MKAPEQEIAKARNQEAASAGDDRPAAAEEHPPAAAPMLFKVGSARQNPSRNEGRPRPASNVFHPRKRLGKAIGPGADIESNKDQGAFEADSEDRRKKVRVA